MGLFDDLKNLSEQVKRRQAHIKGEEATKQALILPFLQVLGYDVYDPTELQPEYTADFAKKKSSGQMEKVDYAIRLGGIPAIFIEAKAVDASTEVHDAQLARYFNATPSVKTGVLTNGLKYRFFTDLQEPNIMSEVPFFEFDVLSFTERDVDTLRLFTKDAYDAGAVHASAEELIYVGKLTALVGELLRNPSESFVRFLLGEIDIVAGKRLTAKVIERFIPVVRKSIQTTLLEMATRSIRLETEEPKLAAVAPLPVPAPAPAPAPTDAPPATGEGSSKVITTADELEALDLVKKLCADSSWSAKYPVLHKDSQNYFGMMVGHTRGWFLRLFADSKRKAIVTRLTPERAAMLSPGFEVEAAPAGFGASRVYLSGVKDLEKLRALVISAYEDAVKRLESGEDEGGSTASAS